MSIVTAEGRDSVGTLEYSDKIFQTIEGQEPEDTHDVVIKSLNICIEICQDRGFFEYETKPKN